MTPEGLSGILGNGFLQDNEPTEMLGHRAGMAEKATRWIGHSLAGRRTCKNHGEA
eukprot:CAMPEP_0204580776 /NCGR_PEP_ID=MMETSP0661-20131031/44248_1 /ASSEMBLY_ACC=CAM_ASM_000606 /TAXON_ID=109239 /ORGANISM="Alexandrium margalefi, Strain AMGDE01CS-322" /LENGTH=54 /DNA_ID=CAMNT_0051589883 /DNA_START=116 /DNA_END=278 /DNA_ORIENTATION=-